MINLAPVFLRESMPGLVSEVPEPGGLKGWMQHGTYGIALGANSGEIVLNGITAASFYPFLLADYARFALAACESLHLSFSSSYDSRATAWPLIKRYYSAFFSAHALLRVHGRGVAWIDSIDAARLERLGKLYVGGGFELGKGSYAFQFHARNQFDAELTLVRVSSGGGSHDDLWRYFTAYLVELGAELLESAAPDAQSSVARFDEIRQIVLASSGRGTWISFMRNEINYQHKFGSWFPFRSPEIGGNGDKHLLQQANDAVNLVISPSREPLKAFNAITCCLAALNKDCASIMKDRAGAGATRFRSEWNRLIASLPN